MNTLIGHSLQADILICRSQGVIHVLKEFKIKILFGFEEHGVFVHGTSKCPYVFPLDWDIVTGPPAARIKSTAPTKLISFLRKSINWKALKGEMDDFIQQWDDQIEYSELDEALEDYLREKQKNRGMDLLRV